MRRGETFVLFELLDFDYLFELFDFFFEFFLNVSSIFSFFLNL